MMLSHLTCAFFPSNCSQQIPSPQDVPNCPATSETLRITTTVDHQDGGNGMFDHCHYVTVSDSPLP